MIEEIVSDEVAVDELVFSDAHVKGPDDVQCDQRILSLLENACN